MTVVEGGGIFVSYRRGETSHLAGRLYDCLAGRFGEGQVLIDVDTTEPGVDFAEEISRAMAACKVLVAIIGPDWLTATDERGRRRLDDPYDVVRLGIEAALARGVRVIPILVESAVMPGQQDLPESLAGLARRNALFIRHETFRYDVGPLVTAIEQVLGASGTTVVSSAPDAHSVRLAGNAVGAVARTPPKPARTDSGRAARLIDDAERAAQSITDRFYKASALASVAKALAAVDINRAYWLIHDAERAAQSLAGPLRSSALASAAKAIAATDPDRAERTVRSITDPSSRASALTMGLFTHMALFGAGQHLLSPKLREPGDANAGGDLDKRCARQVGVLATCHYPARHLAVR